MRGGGAIRGDEPYCTFNACICFCSGMFDAVLAAGVAPKTASNWIMGDIMAYTNVGCALPRLERLSSGHECVPVFISVSCIASGAEDGHGRAQD